MTADVLGDLGAAVAVLGALAIAFECGYQAGSRTSAENDARASSQVGAIQGAVLGLLGLLLAFSFAGAATRFLERQDLIVDEANAIGTAYLRADLLDEPHRAGLQDVLRLYTEHRIEVSLHLQSGIPAGALEAVARFHHEMWKTTVAGVEARPASTLAVVASVNEVIDLHSKRIAAGRKHLPLPVVILLAGCSLVSMAMMGYANGFGRRRRAPLTGALVMLIGAALWITFDLDHPRAGILQLSDAPLQALKFVRASH
jgi:hypothetical protein